MWHDEYVDIEDISITLQCIHVAIKVNNFVSPDSLLLFILVIVLRIVKPFRII